jgi:hypothetical protein
MLPNRFVMFTPGRSRRVQENHTHTRQQVQVTPHGRPSRHCESVSVRGTRGDHLGIREVAWGLSLSGLWSKNNVEAAEAARGLVSQQRDASALDNVLVHVPCLEIWPRRKCRDS